MPETIRKIFASEIKEVQDRTLQFTITTESEDRDGEVVKADGGQFDNYKKNPVVLWAHDYKSLPVGKTVNLEQANKKIVSTVQFPTKEEYEYADTVYKLCKGGYLNAVSIGFIPIDIMRGKNDKEPSRTFTKWDMLEWSIVPVPSNPDALRNAVNAGLITVKEFEAISKTVNFNQELSRNQAKDAFWQLLDTMAMCVMKTCNDKEDMDKPGTMTAHGEAFIGGYTKWIKDAKRSGMFDEMPDDDMPMMMSFREYLTKGIKQDKPEAKDGQAVIADEIDYLKKIVQAADISDDNFEAVYELGEEINRLTGYDNPVQIIETKNPADQEAINEFIQERIKKHLEV